MADKKISDLDQLAGSGLADDDVLAVVDVGGGQTKKITVKDLIQNGVTKIEDDKIPGAKLLFGSDANRIPTDGIADTAITTAKIGSGNNGVTAAKLADNSVLEVYTGATNKPTSGDFTGQLCLDTSDNSLSVWTGSAWTGIKGTSSTINSVGGSTTGIVNITATTTTGAVTIEASLNNTAAANQFMAGPTGAAGAVAFRAIDNSDLPKATNSAKGAVIVNGEGLRMDGDTIEIDNDPTATTTHHIVTYNAKGLITGGRVLSASDLPAATSTAKGAVIPGTGLEVDASGNLNHTNTATAGTFTKVTVDGQGHISSGTTLADSDIPNIPASKIASGTIPADRIGTDAVTAAKLADQSVTKFGGAGATDNVVTFPTGDFKGQFFFDEKNEDLYIFTGQSFLPITVISGNLVNAGTYNANTNLVGTVTTAGSAAGFTAGGALPNPAPGNLNYYVVVSDSGTGSGNAPAVSLAPPDMLISLGSGNTFQLIDVSNAIAGQTAANISVVSTGNIAATDVQAALQELDSEKIGAASPTFTGTVLLGQNAVLAFEGSADDDYETTITVTNPTADRTITIPDVTGTVVTTGDTGSVTSAMIANTTIVDGDISASAEIAVSKLANGSARQLLQTASNGTDVEFTSNVDVPGTLDVTGVATFDSTSTFTGNATFNGNIVMEGTSADDYELTLTCNPTADVTVTLPDATTTVAGLAVAQSFTKAQRGTPVALTDAATIAVDLSLGNNFTVTLAGNRTLGAPTNVTAGQSGVIVVTQDGTGSRTLAYNSAYKFAGGTAPTLTTTASAVDVLAYYVESSTRITVTSLLNVS